MRVVLRCADVTGTIGHVTNSFTCVPLLGLRSRGSKKGVFSCLPLPLCRGGPGGVEGVVTF